MIIPLAYSTVRNKLFRNCCRKSVIRQHWWVNGILKACLPALITGRLFPGQGDYYNPDFITQNNDTIQKHGYITNLITDDAIDWIENKRNPEKPFCLLIHHKAIHRNWLADTCNLALYEDKTFPLPDNFFDDYEGRPAAAARDEYWEGHGHDL